MATSSQSTMPPSASGGSASMIGPTVAAVLLAAVVIGMAWAYAALFGGFDYSAVGTDEVEITGAINLAFSSKQTYTKGNLVPIVKAYSQLDKHAYTPDGKAIYSPFRTRITVTGSGKATYTVHWHSLPGGACRFLLRSFYGPEGLQPTAITANGAPVPLSLTSAVVAKACRKLTGNSVKLVF